MEKLEFKNFDDFVNRYEELMKKGFSSDQINFILTFWYQVLNK